MPVFIIFIILPLLEIMVFSAVSEEIGFGNAAGLIILAMLAGVILIRYQGIQAMLALRAGVALERLFEGFYIMMAGFLLIIPGFITDFLAVALLLPFTRALLKTGLKRGGYWAENPYPGAPAGENFGDVIEGEYVDLGENDEERASKAKNHEEKTLLEGGDKHKGS
ncbi:MAG: FxsA family protein [Alphaproteobacteria bacterium]|nr:FxsA family protein [Alphaproteobacteria bacterium]